MSDCEGRRPGGRRRAEGSRGKGGREGAAPRTGGEEVEGAGRRGMAAAEGGMDGGRRNPGKFSGDWAWKEWREKNKWSNSAVVFYWAFDPLTLSSNFFNNLNEKKKFPR